MKFILLVKINYNKLCEKSKIPFILSILVKVFVSEIKHIRFSNLHIHTCKTKYVREFTCRTLFLEAKDPLSQIFAAIFVGKQYMHSVNDERALRIFC